MAFDHGLNDLVLLTIEVLAGRLAEYSYAALPELSPGETLPQGSVTIVIPARNEAERLPLLLHSLSQLRYPDFEVVVVDDGSSDGTGEIAGGHGARALHIEGPAEGWTGKAYACQVGADATTSDWLLFTDADTIHAPESLGCAVAEASKSRAGLFSLLARQECRTFWERLLLPYAYALYFVGAWRINRPGRPAVANGQYLLFRRAVYDAIGGHASARDSLIEDITLARNVAAAGERVVLARGERLLSVRMYSGLGAIREGFGKNAFRFVRVSPTTGLPTALAGVIFLAGATRALRSGPRPLRLTVYLVPVVFLTRWQRRFGAPRGLALLYPLAGLVFQGIAIESLWRGTRRGRTVWKGRRY
ncbi:MAG: glycosyltransferase [Chloroflexota bacterium]|nr:glycosyltransferase [Chloroflexota bacterium]